MDDKLWWHLTRASGLTAWALLAAAVLWGLTLAGRPVTRPSPAWLLDLHRFLGGAALTFTALHVGTLMLDGFVDFGWREVLVPFASQWRPAPVAWGIAGLYLLVAVQVTSWLKPRLPHAAWRGVHLLTVPLLAVASAHAFLAGTDLAGSGSGRAARWAALAVGAMVTFLLVYRVLARRAGRQVGRPGATATADPAPPGGPDLDLLVRQTRWEADGIMSFALAHPDGRELPPWEPGAHLELLLPSGLQRQYSLCGDPADRTEYRIAVLSSPDGRGGAREIHERVRAGGLVPVRGPRNRFPLVDAPGYVFVAGGIGITPMLPMARAVATRGADWQLHYTGRTKETMAFADEALDLDPARVHLVPSATHGRLDVLALLATAPPASAVYCCGPGALVQAVADALDDPGRLHVERFQAARTAAPDPAATRFDVELARTGAVLAVPADRSVLDVVRAAVPGVAASCGEGICGTCEVRVLGGVPDHRDHVLGADERARGETMMICVSRAVTPTLVLDL